MQIFAGVREIWGVKQETGRLRCRFSYLSLAIFSESSFPRLKSATHSICVKLLHKHDKLTQCCHAFTLALARLSCLQQAWHQKSNVSDAQRAYHENEWPASVVWTHCSIALLSNSSLIMPQWLFRTCFRRSVSVISWYTRCWRVPELNNPQESDQIS